MITLRKKRFWILVFILLFNLAAALNIKTGTAQETKLYVDPSEIKNSSLGIGSTFTVNLNILEADNLFGWQANITFNPAVVNVTLVLEGPFLKDDWSFDTTWPDPVVDNTAGTLLIGCLISPPYTLGMTGAYYDGTLAMITFMVKAEGRGTLLGFVPDSTLLKTVINTVVVPITDFTTEDGSFDNRPIDQNVGPIAVFDVKSLDATKRGQVSFDASDSNDPDAWLVSYNWDYGDGTTEVYMREPLGIGNLTAKTTHVYPQNGTFTVTLTVKDNDNATDIASAQVTVLFDLEVVNVESPFILVMPGVPVTVDVTVANNGDFYEAFNVTAYYNDTLIERRPIANMAPKTQQTLTYDWNTTGLELGEYFLKANVTILDEETNTANNAYLDGSVTIATSNIVDFPLLVGGVTFHVMTNSTSIISDLSFNPPEKKLSFKTTGPEGADVYCNITIPIELLGGNYTVLLNGLPVVPDPQEATNGTHTFLYFNYTLSTLDTIEIIGETAATPPSAIIIASETNPFVDELVTLDGSSSYDLDGSIVNWSWNFGDSATASDETVQHSYSTFGNYTVTLTVEDDEGYIDSTETTIRVKDYPTARFTYSPANPLVNETVVLDATASKPEGGSIINYEWDFGDGQTGTGSAPTHAYVVTGAFIVNLTVTDSEGLSNSTTQTVTVTIHNIAITNVAASPDTVKKGATITIEITASNKGNYTETFTVTAYYNRTAIETKSVVDMSPGDAQPMTIAWNTTRVVPGIYVLKAEASIVTKETKTDDNSLLYGTVTIQKLNSSLSISASSLTLVLGRNTIIHGTLNPSISSTSIMIQYRVAGQEWLTLASVAGDAQAAYILNWRPNEPGTYEVQASWEGDPNTEACQSSMLTITVNEGETPQTVLYLGMIAAIIVLAALAIYFIRSGKR
jgi:PKD repeat protein